MTVAVAAMATTSISSNGLWAASLQSTPSRSPITVSPPAASASAASAPATSRPIAAGGATADEQGATREPAAAGQSSDEQTRAAAAAEADMQRLLQGEIRQLAQRDREVRTHEQAHQAVGGQYAGSVSYDFQRGPDGRQYAVGGSVSIDVAPVPNDPQATLQKMQIVQRAALAPAEPSAQDRVVAAQAAQQAAAARAELAQQGVEAEGSTASSAAADAGSEDAADSTDSPGSDMGRQSQLAIDSYQKTNQPDIGTPLLDMRA